MRSGRFAIGVLAGILLASGIVLTSSYGFAPPQSAPALFGTRAVVSTTTVSTTSSTLAPTSVSAPNTTTTTSSCACASFYLANASGLSASTQAAAQESPSSVTKILSQPTQSLLLLAPLALALLLGFVFYRSSVPRD